MLRMQFGYFIAATHQNQDPQTHKVMYHSAAFQIPPPRLGSMTGIQRRQVADIVVIIHFCFFSFSFFSFFLFLVFLFFTPHLQLISTPPRPPPNLNQPLHGIKSALCMILNSLKTLFLSMLNVTNHLRNLPQGVDRRTSFKLRQRCSRNSRCRSNRPRDAVPSSESVWEPVIHSHFALSTQQASQVLLQRPPAFFTQAIPEDHHQPIADKK